MSEKMPPSKSSSRPILLAIGVFAILFLGLFIAGFGDIRRDLMLSRFQGQCGPENPQACGQEAQLLMQTARDRDDLVQGFEKMNALCDQENWGACRMAAYAQTPEFFNQLGESQVMISRDRKQNAFDACVSGDERGCHILTTLELEPAEAERAIKASASACSVDKPWACRSERHLILALHGKYAPKDDEVDLCPLGFNECAEGLENKTSADELHDALQQACKNDRSGYGCYYRALIAAKFHPDEPWTQPAVRLACHAGERAACGYVVIPETAPHADVLRSIYSRFSMTFDEIRDAQTPSDISAFSFMMRKDDPRWTAVTTSELDVLEACQDGVAIACFAQGLQLMDKGRKSLEPRLPLYESMESSFGRACDLGVDSACLAGALYLLDRPISEDRKVKEANAWLSKACKRGHSRACWTTDLGDELRADDFSTYRELSETRCKASMSGIGGGACDALAGLWSHDLGGTDWVFGDRIGFEKLREICKRSNSLRTCVWTAEMMHNDAIQPFAWSVPGYNITAFGIFKTICESEKAYPWSCAHANRHMNLIPGVPPSIRVKKARELCAHAPQDEDCTSLPSTP